MCQVCRKGQDKTLRQSLCEKKHSYCRFAKVFNKKRIHSPIFKQLFHLLYWIELYQRICITSKGHCPGFSWLECPVEMCSKLWPFSRGLQNWVWLEGPVSKVFHLWPFSRGWRVCTAPSPATSGTTEIGHTGPKMPPSSHLLPHSCREILTKRYSYARKIFSQF